MDKITILIEELTLRKKILSEDLEFEINNINTTQTQYNNRVETILGEIILLESKILYLVGILETQNKRNVREA